jgi:hypothetical protein
MSPQRGSSSGSRKLLRQMSSGVEFEFCRRGSSTEKSCNNNGRQVGDALHAGCEAHELITVMARNKYQHMRHLVDSSESARVS